MKKLLFLLTICIAATLTVGCGSGPEAGTKEEADQSMDASMSIMEADPAAAPSDTGAAPSSDAPSSDAATPPSTP